MYSILWVGGRGAPPPQPNVRAVWPQLFRQVKRGGAASATGSVANNTLVIISPKGAPALCEVGQDAAGDGVKQLSNAKAPQELVFRSDQQFVLLCLLCS